MREGRITWQVEGLVVSPGEDPGHGRGGQPHGLALQDHVAVGVVTHVLRSCHDGRTCTSNTVTPCCQAVSFMEQFAVRLFQTLFSHKAGLSVLDTISQW